MWDIPGDDPTRLILMSAGGQFLDKVDINMSTRQTFAYYEPRGFTRLRDTLTSYNVVLEVMSLEWRIDISKPYPPHAFTYGQDWEERQRIDLTWDAQILGAVKLMGDRFVVHPTR